MVSLSTGMETCMIISIGADSMTAIPVFAGVPLLRHMQSDKCGGATIDRALADMLSIRCHEDFNQMTTTRQENYAETLKKEHCFMSQDFAGDQETKGAVQVQMVQVLGGGAPSSKLTRAYTVKTTHEEDDRDEPVIVELLQKSGKVMRVKLGRERWHAPEVMFTPQIWNGCEHTKSIDELMLDSALSCDPSIWKELLGNIFIEGKTGLIPGLAKRLKSELRAGLYSRDLPADHFIKTSDKIKVLAKEGDYEKFMSGDGFLDYCISMVKTAE